MIVRFSGVLLCLAALLTPAHLPGGEFRPHGILVIDQSDLRGPFYGQIFSELRTAAMQADPDAHVAVYSESLDLGRLPPGSEIRFRDPTMWETYRWRGALAVAVIVLQAILIAVLLHERKRRSDAEKEVRARISELAHLNRQATAGELSSSIAHELNQPLGSILTNAETAQLILQSPRPNLPELKEIVADIRRDDLRASDVIRRLRSLLKRAPFEIKIVDLNNLMREVFGFLAVQASARKVTLDFQPAPGELQVKGDPVQLQQVILNLVVNSMEAMSATPDSRTVIGRTELNGSSLAVVSVSDSGPGVPPEKLAEVFDPFFTTKHQGMGVGLSIARTIVQAHKGKIWAENQPEGGVAFHFSMPLALH